MFLSAPVAVMSAHSGLSMVFANRFPPFSLRVRFMDSGMKNSGDPDQD
jgi:hypothetical protein